MGAMLLAAGVTEEWMPALAGGLFLIPLGISVAMLVRVPAPSSIDITARSSDPQWIARNVPPFFRDTLWV